jgi:hypothetical protein
MAYMTRRVKTQTDAQTGVIAVNTTQTAIDSGFGQPAVEIAVKEIDTQMSDLEEKFLEQVKVAGFPNPKREYKFHATRKWRLDFYWDAKDTRSFPVAVEVEGGTFMRGMNRHTSGIGFQKDCEKYNEVALARIVLLRVTGTHVKDGRAIDWLRRAALWEMDLVTAMRLSDGRLDE